MNKPISPTAHAIADYAVAALSIPAAAALPKKSAGVLGAVGVVSVATNLMTDHGLGVMPRIPVNQHLKVDLLTGAALLLAGYTFLRDEPRAARNAVIGVGLYSLAAGLMTQSDGVSQSTRSQLPRMKDERVLEELASPT
ncbi:MAG TPA: hypothetical protein VD997_05115 [Phycisphaerales bacterium]|nr:hypothetical protein [Phycisphaerales bacterium]